MIEFDFTNVSIFNLSVVDKLIKNGDSNRNVLVMFKEEILREFISILIKVTLRVFKSFSTFFICIFEDMQVDER